VEIMRPAGDEGDGKAIDSAATGADCSTSTAARHAAAADAIACSGMDGGLEDLADRLIEADYRSQDQLGALYRFLVRSCAGDSEAARMEFIRFLRGELSPTLLDLARAEIRSGQSSVVHVLRKPA
jgi:hypothetical protein